MRGTILFTFIIITFMASVMTAPAPLATDEIEQTIYEPEIANVHDNSSPRKTRQFGFGFGGFPGYGFGGGGFGFPGYGYGGGFGYPGYGFGGFGHHHHHGFFG